MRSFPIGVFPPELDTATSIVDVGKPTQNAFVESLDGKFREYCLNLHWFAAIDNARVTITHWKTHYTVVRPHRSLGRKPPTVLPKETA